MYYITRLNPKLLLTQFVLNSKEYDQKNSEILYESIRTGEETWRGQEIDEEDLILKVEEAFRDLQRLEKSKKMDAVYRKYGTLIPGNLPNQQPEEKESEMTARADTVSQFKQ